VFNLAWPYAAVVALLPLLIFWLLPPARDGGLTVVRVPFFSRLWQKLGASLDQASGLVRALALLAWLSLTAAAMRPQWVGEPVPMPQEGRDLMLAVDLSGSMEQHDMVINGRRVDRLTAVKAVAGNFIERRQGDRIGLILFGRNAYLQAPLTFDRKTVKKLLYEAQIGMAGKETAIGDAIGLAVKKARETSDNNRVLILLTDGQNTAGEIDPIKAAELAKAEGIKTYTIGIGSSGRGSVFAGWAGGSGLDERTLRAIAQMTGGRYFRARNVQELAQIYDLLDKLEPRAKAEEFFRPVKELYYLPLGIGLLWLLLALWRKTWS